MASWNSHPLEISYQVLGWIAFFSWTICFYPQVILNFRRKSVVGLNFDFLVLSLTKHLSYLIYNASMFFSPEVQRQYRKKYGLEQMIPVAANDVAFSIHAVTLTAFTLFQVLLYDRGNQKVSKTCIAISAVVWVSAAVCVFIALPTHSWLWLISVFNTIQVILAVLKFVPQAIMNFMRKSTEGWSIGARLLDLSGGSWVNFYGNIGKNLLSLATIVFDLLFVLQHYVLYPPKDEGISSEA